MKKLRRIRGHRVAGERVQVAVLSGVVRVGLLEKVMSEQREKGINHMATHGRQRYSRQDRGTGR